MIFQGYLGGSTRCDLSNEVREFGWSRDGCFEVGPEGGV